MAARRPPENEGRSRTGDDAALDARLRRLGEQLRTHAPAERGGGGDGENGSITANPSNLGRALRLSGEFAGGIVVGAFIGWLIDSLLGTTPWALMVFILLGFAAGTFNALRSAGLMSQQNMNEPRKRD